MHPSLQKGMGVSWKYRTAQCLHKYLFYGGWDVSLFKRGNYQIFLKKSDSVEMGNCRLVSNFPQLGRHPQRWQILWAHFLMASGHAVGTVLVGLMSDLCQKIERGSMTFLVLLTFLTSKAFDIVDYGSPGILGNWTHPTFQQSFISISQVDFKQGHLETVASQNRSHYIVFLWDPCSFQSFSIIHIKLLGEFIIRYGAGTINVLRRIIAICRLQPMIVKLDYCEAVYVEVPLKKTLKLQKI